MFLDYGGDKEFGVKGYVDGATIWNSSKWSAEAAFTIWHREFAKYIRIWMLQTRWLKPLSQAKHDQTPELIES